MLSSIWLLSHYLHSNSNGQHSAIAISTFAPRLNMSVDYVLKESRSREQDQQLREVIIHLNNARFSDDNSLQAAPI